MSKESPRNGSTENLSKPDIAQEIARLAKGHTSSKPSEVWLNSAISHRFGRLVCALGLVLSLTLPVRAQLVPPLQLQFFNSTGTSPLASGFLCTTQSGGSISQLTYQDQAKQIVADAVYRKVREQIEAAAQNAGSAIQDLNRQMGDILPIRDAVIRRIPVAQRQEILSLKEFLGAAMGNKLGFGLSVFDRTARSPWWSNMFVKGAQAAPDIAPRIGQVGAGATSTQ